MLTSFTRAGGGLSRCTALRGDCERALGRSRPPLLPCLSSRDPPAEAESEPNPRAEKADAAPPAPALPLSPPSAAVAAEAEVEPLRAGMVSSRFSGFTSACTMFCCLRKASEETTCSAI